MTDYATRFDAVEATLRTAGPVAAAERLCATLSAGRDHHALFYAMLLRKRLELGMSPIPTAPVEELPEKLQAAYEEGVREAARHVGVLLLGESDIPQAWLYFRMIGEPGPVALALDCLVPAEGQDVRPLVEVAYHEGVHPRKGFDLVLDHFGVCSAITLLSEQAFPHAPVVREHCIARLVSAIHTDLAHSLRREMRRRHEEPPAAGGVRDLISGREWLFADEAYHVDISHLGAVVQMSVHLPCGPELELARALCAYGQRLSPRLRFPGEPPFENLFEEHAIYLAALAGEEVEAGVAHFRAKAQAADSQTSGTGQAETVVTLLLRLGRPAEALALAREHLPSVDGRGLSCPGIAELSRRVGNYTALVEVARLRGDPVHFLAGLIAGERA